MEHGWFKMNREILTDEVLCHNSEYLAVWCFLCAHAVFKEHQARFKGKLITLQPGQLITGRRVIAEATKLNEFKVERILSFFESAQRIAQQTSNMNRLITILEPDDESRIAQPSLRQEHGQSTTDALPMHTIKKDKKERMKESSNSARTHANSRGNEKWKRGQESVYSSDASYDLQEWARTSMERILNYKPKHAETSAKDVG